MRLIRRVDLGPLPTLHRKLHTQGIEPDDVLNSHPLRGHWENCTWRPQEEVYAKSYYTDVQAPVAIIIFSSVSENNPKTPQLGREAVTGGKTTCRKKPVPPGNLGVYELQMLCSLDSDEVELRRYWWWMLVFRVCHERGVDSRVVRGRSSETGRNM